MLGVVLCKCPIQAYPLNQTLETLRDFLQDRFCIPLGLSRTRIEAPSPLPPPHLTPPLPPFFFFLADCCGCHAFVSYSLRRGATRQMWSFVSFRLVSSFRVCLLLIFLHLHFLIQTLYFLYEPNSTGDAIRVSQRVVFGWRGPGKRNRVSEREAHTHRQRDRMSSRN